MSRRWEPLRRAVDIADVRGRGYALRSGPVTVWLLPRPGRSRAALAVPARPLGHVARNRVRRRARAALDAVLPATGVEVVVGVRPGAQPTYRELLAVLERAVAETSGCHVRGGEDVG